jgi:phage shock protein A
MSLWSRIKLLFKFKTSAALDRAEDPREVLDYAYGQQQDFLRKVRQGLIEVATSKHQLEVQVQKQLSCFPKLEEQAKRALAAEREDLARFVLQRKQTVIAELDGLEQQLAEVSEEERRLILAEQQIAARIEDFRTRRQTVSARYTAAEAQVRMKEALSGVTGELGELSMALGRAEEKTQRMLARASAIDSLIDSGSLQLMAGGGDMVEKELHELTAAAAVEEELAALKVGRSRELLIPPSEESMEVEQSAPNRLEGDT